jgi:hypothetical protein
MRAHSTACAPRVKRKNATKMTNYAFSDNAVQRIYFLVIFQAWALNTRGHLQSAATDGNREAQRSSAGLTRLWPEASSGACWKVAKTMGAQVACRASCSLGSASNVGDQR